MIYSMTAFSRQAEQSNWGKVVWEMRAVNHRFLDCSFKMPENFRQIEMGLRELIREKLQRGRIECALQYKPATKDHSSLSIDKNLVESLVYAINEVKQFMPEAKSVNPLQILAWPNVLQTGEENIEFVQNEIIKLFKRTLDELIVSRAREGGELQKVLEKKLNDIAINKHKIKTKSPEIVQIQRNKILSKFEEFKAELDQQRLEQELVLFAQKVDIMEEIDRLGVHIKEMHRILRDGGYVGKRLDFLLQELNRETNTIASKSVDSEITSVAVEMKVIIEQMREQVQNIE